MERAGNESSFALCRLKLEEPMFRKMQDPWALTYSAKKTKDGKNSGIKVISSPESFLSFLRFPSSLPVGMKTRVNKLRTSKPVIYSRRCSIRKLDHLVSSSTAIRLLP